MRIIVKGNGNNIHIPIPTGLIFSKASAWLWLKSMQMAEKSYISRYMPEAVMDNLSDEAVYAICAELMRIKRKYGSWDLVEVKSSEGDHVLIRL